MRLNDDQHQNERGSAQLTATLTGPVGTPQPEAVFVDRAGNPAESGVVKYRKHLAKAFNLQRIADMPIFYFVALFAVGTVAAYLDLIPQEMLTGFGVALLLGCALMWIGQRIPVLRDFGLPTILCTFVPAIFIYFGLMPQNVNDVATVFLKDQGFLNFFVIAVIAGTILGMPRKLLLVAGPRFVVPIVGCLVLTFVTVGAIGALTGFGFIEAILFIAAPIMAGGLGIGALPMSEMYATQTGAAPDVFMGQLMSAVVAANVVCILIAGVYNWFTKRGTQLFVGFNGNGQLMRIKGKTSELTLPPKKSSSAFVSLGKGLLIAAVLFLFGIILNHFMPFLHEYAWTIIAAALIKIFGLFPAELEEAASEWGDLLTTYFVPALLVCVSIAYIDIEEVLVSLANPMFLVLTVATVVLATLTSGVLGWLVKFNFIEAAITPGLVMADTGGSGDVSVLSAADRMHLMPFAALTNRIGGALVLFVTSLIVPFLAFAG